jgi:hypothetical protein
MPTFYGTETLLEGTLLRHAINRNLGMLLMLKTRSSGRGRKSEPVHAQGLTALGTMVTRISPLQCRSHVLVQPFQEVLTLGRGHQNIELTDCPLK